MKKIFLIILGIFLLFCLTVIAGDALYVPNDTSQTKSDNKPAQTDTKPSTTATQTPKPVPVDDKASQTKAAQDKADTSTADDQSVLPAFIGK